MRILVDAAIPGSFDDLGQVTRLAGEDIDRGALTGVDALIVRSVTRVDSALVSGTPVDFVGSATIGQDHVDVGWLARAGITFANARGCNANAVTQFVLATVVGAARHNSDWAESSTVGVVGHGAIGGRVARLFRALGRTVLVSDPPQQAVALDPDVTYVPLPQLIEECGVVSVHVPLTRDGAHPTHHLFGAAELGRMPADALLVNTSRGAVIDHRVLAAGGYAGFLALDVWEGEPNLCWPVLADARVLWRTPHVAGYSREGKATATAMIRRALAEHRGLAVSETGCAFSPQVVSTEGLPSRLAAHEAAAWCLLQACPLVADDRAMRSLLDLPEAERAGAFSRQRANYPLRAEFEGWRVPARVLESVEPSRREAVVASLKLAGFMVDC
ncbi:MAG: 4-phosphoerythronate dehydrogenase [Deltaproteobacteria bacterium]|nr:4-phosphoerythronate dehydrogenase [Deltaproteobacteria bacterium]